VLIAPTAFHRLAHSDGELATVRAAAKAKTLMIVSMASTVAIEEIVTASNGGEVWFQIYIQPDMGFTEAIIRRVEAAGCKALVVTVDSPVFGRRERDLRNGFMDLPIGLCCENMRELSEGENFGDVKSIAFSAQLSWKQIDWLRQKSSLPIVLKGILHPKDAKAAVAHGADGVIVSNHGGRQLDSVPATIEVLPSVVEAVEERIPILMDGGIRRGTDIVKALALGAKAVAIGRPTLWGLAADGEKGIVTVLELLREELKCTLALCGCSSLGDIDSDLVRRLKHLC